MSELKDLPPKSPKIDFADETVTPDPSLFEEKQLEPVFLRHVLTSPLHMSVARASRTNLWESWNGITTAQVLTSINDEYLALRTRAALSDISPLAKYRISGRDATDYLSRLVTDDVSRLSIDHVMHVVFCEENGLIVGDGQLFRLDKMEYRLVSERPHLAWLLDNQLGFRVKVEDVSASLAGLHIAGPLAAQMLISAGFEGIETLKKNRARWCRPGGAPVYVSQVAMSDTYDLWVDKEDASPLWARLMRAGEPLGLTPAGRRACDLVRIEAGLPLEGRDYVGAFYASQTFGTATPFDFVWGDMVDLTHGVFNGRAALRRMAGTPTQWTCLHVQIEAEKELSFGTLYLGNEIVGRLTSCAFMPLLGKHVGLARVATRAAKSAKLQAGPERHDSVGIRRPVVPAQIGTEPALS